MIRSSRSRMRARPQELLVQRRPRFRVLRALQRIQADALEVARDRLEGKVCLDVGASRAREALALAGVAEQGEHAGCDLRGLVRLQIMPAMLERQAFDADGGGNHRATERHRLE